MQRGKSETMQQKNDHPISNHYPQNHIRIYFGARQRIVDNGNNRRGTDKEPFVIKID